MSAKVHKKTIFVGNRIYFVPLLHKKHLSYGILPCLSEKKHRYLRKVHYVIRNIHNLLNITL